MDKNEYRIRLEQINKYIRDKRYRDAIAIADEINWNQIRSVKTLCKISDLYKVCKRYPEAKILLERAHDKNPDGRQILYSLCEICIKMEDIIGATEYYKKYSQVAPTDTGRDVLLYKIYEAQDVNLNERIELLENMKKKEYTERWGYELACLYHKVGLASKCVEECDELILWFREGRFVKKAMELKMLHQQLTASQEALYSTMVRPGDGIVYKTKGDSDPKDSGVSGKSGAIGTIKSTGEMILKEEADDREPVQSAGGNTTGNMDIPYSPHDVDTGSMLRDSQKIETPTVKQIESPTFSSSGDVSDGGKASETDEDKASGDDIQVKTLDLGQYGTINIQQALAESMKSVMEGDEAQAGLEQGAEAALFPNVSSYEDSSLYADRNYPGGDYSGQQSYDAYAGDGNQQQSYDAYAGDGNQQQGYDVYADGDNQQGYIYPDNQNQEFYKGFYQGYYEAYYNNQQPYMGEQDYSNPTGMDQIYPDDGQQENQDDLQEGNDYTMVIPVVSESIPETIYENKNHSEGDTAVEEGAQTKELGLDMEPQPVTQDTIVYNLKRTPNAIRAEVRNLPDMDYSRVTKEELLDLINSKVNEALDNAALNGMFLTPDAINQYSMGEQPINYPQDGYEGYTNISRVARSTPPESMSDMLRQEYDGQISMVVPEYEKVEKQITGQINLEEYIASWENSKKLNMERHLEDRKKRLSSNTGELFNEFEREAIEFNINHRKDNILTDEDVANLPNPSDAEENPAADMSDDGGDTNVNEDAHDEADTSGAWDEAASAIIEAEDRPVDETEAVTDEALEETGTDTEIPEEEAAEVKADAESHTEIPAEKDVESETEAESQIEVLVETGTEAEAPSEGEEEAEAEAEAPNEAEEETEVEAEEETEAEAEAPNEAEEETEAEPQEEASTENEAEAVNEAAEQENLHETDTEEHSDHRTLTEQEMDLFREYIHTKTGKRELIAELDKISLASYTGNVFVTGGINDETAGLAKSVMKYVQMTDSNFVGKTGKVTGNSLNDKPVDGMVKKFAGGGVVIEKAGSMSAEALKNLLDALNQEKYGILVIMMDNTRTMNRMLKSNPEMKNIFNVHIKTEELSDNTLAKYGRQYAETFEFSVDEMGMLAMHTKIENLRTSDHAVTVTDVREIMDAAMDKCSRRTMRHFMDILLGKRYDDNGFIIIKEDDFDL